MPGFWAPKKKLREGSAFSTCSEEHVGSRKRPGGHLEGGTSGAWS